MRSYLYIAVFADPFGEIYFKHTVIVAESEKMVSEIGYRKLVLDSKPLKDLTIPIDRLVMPW